MTLDEERACITVHECVYKECWDFCFMRIYWIYLVLLL